MYTQDKHLAAKTSRGAPALGLAVALSFAWAGCTATPIEIPGADGGALPMADSGGPGKTADSGFDAAAAYDAGAMPDAFAPDVFDPFDQNGASATVAVAGTVDGLPGLVTALHADAIGLVIAAGAELFHWAAGASAVTSVGTAPGLVQQLATGSGPSSRIYFATDKGIQSLGLAGGGADLQTHHAPAAGEPFFGGVAVGTSWLFVCDAGGRQVLRIPLAGGDTEVIYTSPYQQATTLSPRPVALGDRVFFADFDGPMQVDEQAKLSPIGPLRSDYRWAGAVATADALLVAQRGDFTEAVTRISLPGGAEEVLIWIGGSNNNSGLYGPLLFGDQLAWGMSAGTYLTDLATKATVELVDGEALIAGDAAAGVLYWAPVSGTAVNSGKLPTPTPTP